VKRFAAIDVGTNTVLLLVADVGDGGELLPLQDLEMTTRLGRGLAATRRLHPESLSKTMEAIDAYLAVCDKLGVDEIRIVGTSALREAQNGDDLVNAVERRFGLILRPISGEEEARFSYLAAEREMGPGRPLLVVDIGGGSVEIIVGQEGNLSDLHSLNVGAVGLTETFLTSDPVREEEFGAMMDHIIRNLAPVALPRPTKVVGLGGTITALSAVQRGDNLLNPSEIHGTLLSRQEVYRQVLLYRGTTVEKRCRIAGLPSERADVILAGAAILWQTLSILDLREVVVSCHGLRYGLLYAAILERSIEKTGKSC